MLCVVAILLVVLTGLVPVETRRYSVLGLLILLVLCVTVDGLLPVLLCTTWSNVLVYLLASGHSTDHATKDMWTPPLDEYLLST
jgi:uncharacterized membrane protein